METWPQDAQISLVTWFLNLLLFFFFSFFIELQDLELLWNSWKVQFQGFSLGCYGRICSQLCSLCVLWMILDLSVLSPYYSCS